MVGSLYILDEPSIGLHPNDTKKLVDILKKLRDLGNTVIVVEHDEEIIREADHIIDIGPMAGSNGGEIVAEGRFKVFKYPISRWRKRSYIGVDIEDLCNTRQMCNFGTK